MGIRFFCPNGHKLNVKSELAGKIGICPKCQARMTIPLESVRESSHRRPTSNGADARKDEEPKTAAFDGKAEERENAGVASQNETYALQNPENAEENAPLNKFFMNGDRAEAALGDVLRRAVDGSAQTARGTERDDETCDPLRDPSLVWYVRSRDNQQYGPAPGDVMQSWINERRIGPQTLVWREDWEAWQEASRVFPELGRVFTSETGASAGGDAAVSAFASLAEAAQNSGAARRFTAEDESRAMRRRKKASKTFAAIVGLIALILALLGALIFVLVKG